MSSSNGAELYSAAYHGNAASIRRLISRGADLNWRHPQGGATTLYVACEFGHAEAAQLLLDSGAPADTARDDGATVDVIFKRFGIGWLKLPAPKSARGVLTTTYLDDEMRISRGDRGNVFVLVKEGPSKI